MIEGINVFIYSLRLSYMYTYSIWNFDHIHPILLFQFLVDLPAGMTHKYCIYWLWKSVSLCSQPLIVRPGCTRLAGYVNVCHILTCPKREASCCGEGHIAPSVYWLSLHKKELGAGAGAGPGAWAERPTRKRHSWESNGVTQWQVIWVSLDGLAKEQSQQTGQRL